MVSYEPPFEKWRKNVRPKRWNNQRCDSTNHIDENGDPASDFSTMKLTGPCLLTDIVWTVCPVVYGSDWQVGEAGGGAEYKNALECKATGIQFGLIDSAGDRYEWDASGAGGATDQAAGVTNFFGALYSPVPHDFVGGRELSPTAAGGKLTQGGGGTQFQRGLGQVSDINFYAPEGLYILITLQMGPNVPPFQTIAAAIGWEDYKDTATLHKIEPTTYTDGDDS